MKSDNYFVSIISRLSPIDWGVTAVVLTVGGYVLIQAVKPIRSVPDVTPQVNEEVIFSPTVENAKSFKRSVDALFADEQKLIITKLALEFRSQALVDREDPTNPDCYQRPIDACLDSYEKNRVGSISSEIPGSYQRAINNDDTRSIAIITIELAAIREARYNPPTEDVNLNSSLIQSAVIADQNLRKQLEASSPDGRARACNAVRMLNGECQP